MGGDVHIADEILARCRRGDARAFQILVDQLKRPAYYHALTLLGNHEDALDISQEAFVKAWLAIRSYDMSRPFYPWYYTILKRLALNLLRSGGRRREESIDIHPDPVDHAGQHDCAEAAQTARAVQRVLHALPLADREIVCMKDMHDCTYKEIALILAVPVGTVMSRLYTARQRFRKLLEETGYEH